MTFQLIHSRLSFGLLVRAAKRSGQLRYYRRTTATRIAVLNGGEVHTYHRGSLRAECEHREAAMGRTTWARQAEGR